MTEQAKSSAEKIADEMAELIAMYRGGMGAEEDRAGHVPVLTPCAVTREAPDGFVESAWGEMRDAKHGEKAYVPLDEYLRLKSELDSIKGYVAPERVMGLKYTTIEEDVIECGRSVVQVWMEDMSLKQQTVVLSALRGCDGVAKDDPSKQLIRAFRAIVLHNAAPGQGTFMATFPERHIIDKFLRALDVYPMHWLFHFLHAVQLVGLYYPTPGVANRWHQLYLDVVTALHLNPETFAENAARLADGFSRDCWKM